MAYETSISIPALTVKHKDTVITVKADGRPIGRLKLSKGSAVWVPGNGKKGYRLGWKRLGELFEDYGKRGDFPI